MKIYLNSKFEIVDKKDAVIAKVFEFGKPPYFIKI